VQQVSFEKLSIAAQALKVIKKYNLDSMIFVLQTEKIMWDEICQDEI
jgi:hypothetical protein